MNLRTVYCFYVCGANIIQVVYLLKWIRWKQQGFKRGKTGSERVFENELTYYTK